MLCSFLHFLLELYNLTSANFTNIWNC